MDYYVSDAYKKVRDATVCNEYITMSEAISILECIKAELTALFLEDMKPYLDDGED